MESKTISLPSEFKPLFDRTWREAAIYGGRFSLKSHSVARFLLIRARQAKTRVACFREFQNSISESSHQLLADLIRHYDLTDFEVTNNSIVNTLNGSDFLFKGLWHNEQTIKSIEGIDIAWVEEAQTVSSASLETLTPTIRKEGSQIVYTYNRLMEDDPVHQRLVLEGRPNTLIINVNYDIALKYGMMPDSVRLEMEDDKARRPSLYKHKWLGEPNSLEQRIYRDWAVIEDVPHEARLERYGVDFGWHPDPAAIVAVYYFNGGYVLDEVACQLEMSNREMAETLKNLPRALIIADSAEPKSISEIRQYGLNVTPTLKGPDSVRHGIKAVQDQRISVTKRSGNLLKEYRNYIWATDKDGHILPGTPEGGNDHCLDAARYAINSLVPVIRRKELYPSNRNAVKRPANIAV